VVIGPVSNHALLCLLGAFVVTFLVARHVTSRIRVGLGRFADLVVGTLHFHHVVWGVALVLVAGTSEFAFRPTWPLTALPAVAFGVGAALMLDEFALVVYMRDVYWSEEGRRSIEAVVVMTIVLGMLVQFLTPTHRPHWNTAVMIALITADVLLMAICLAKGKVFTGLLGIFVPYVLIVGAVRLARPNTLWARLFYRSRFNKLRRACARFKPNRRHERGRQRVLEAIGLALQPADVAGTPVADLSTAEGSSTQAGTR
jgi:hypothetical protein